MPERKWIILKVKPRTEKKMLLMMRKFRVWCYLPSYVKTRKVQRRKVRTVLPIFPGYLLAWFDADQRLTVWQTNLVVNMLPVAQPRKTIHQIRQVVRAVRNERPFAIVPISWSVGDRIRITKGPLKDVEGRIMNVDRKTTLVIGIDAFGAAVSVTLSPDDCTVLKD